MFVALTFSSRSSRHATCSSEQVAGYLCTVQAFIKTNNRGGVKFFPPANPENNSVNIVCNVVSDSQIYLRFCLLASNPNASDCSLTPLANATTANITVRVGTPFPVVYGLSFGPSPPAIPGSNTGATVKCSTDSELIEHKKAELKASFSTLS